MTVVRTTEHSDTDPDWDGPVIAAQAELPARLRGAPRAPAAVTEPALRNS